jgi:hypothetical protein
MMSGQAAFEGVEMATASAVALAADLSEQEDAYDHSRHVRSWFRGDSYCF